jgi:hypothetical protein
MTSAETRRKICKTMNPRNVIMQEYLLGLYIAFSKAFVCMHHRPET